jgi:MFS transporter, MHS family, proline/betaine transporter
MFVYIVSWLEQVDRLNAPRALEINTISMIALVVFIVTMGWLSDVIGRKRVMYVATMIVLVGAVPLFWMMTHTEPILILLGQLGFALAVGMYLGPLPAALAEASPPGIRCSTVALGYNLALGTVGGLTPMAAAWLIQRTQDDMSPAFIAMTAAAVSLIAIRMTRGIGVAAALSR